MLGALGILFPEVLEKYAGIEFGVSTCFSPASELTPDSMICQQCMQAVLASQPTKCYCLAVRCFAIKSEQQPCVFLHSPTCSTTATGTIASAINLL